MYSIGSMCKYTPFLHMLKISCAENAFLFNKEEIHKIFFIKFVHKENFMYICIVIKTKRYGKRDKNATGCKTYPVKIVI